MSLSVIILVVIVSLIWVIPTARILTRLGFNKAWALVSIVPVAALVGLWVIAFVPWPVPDASEDNGRYA